MQVDARLAVIPLDRTEGVLDLHLVAVDIPEVIVAHGGRTLTEDRDALVLEAHLRPRLQRETGVFSD